MIYFITVNYYSTKLITKLILSLTQNTQIPYQLVIVNNSPQDLAINQLSSDSVLIIESTMNLGFGSACNLGLNWVYSQNPCGMVWIINPDAYVLEDSIEKAMNLCNEYPELSIIGTVIHTESGSIWFAGGIFTPQTGNIRSKEYLDLSSDVKFVESMWVSACSLIINFVNFQCCPQFDSKYFLYYEDFDFCIRYLKQGHTVVIAPQIRVVHQPSSITNRNIANKLRHSTYSYLLTIQKYSSLSILLLRFSRIFIHAIILLPIKPQMAVGKIHGALCYLKSKI